MAYEYVPWLDGLDKLIGSAGADAVKEATERIAAAYAEQTKHEAEVAKTAQQQQLVNSKAQQLFNTKRQEEQQAISKAAPMVTGVGSQSMATNYDFDKLAKQYDVRYGRSYSEFDDLIKKFNVSRLPDYDGAPQPFIGHIIMSRPSLYVNTNSAGSSVYGAGDVAATPDAGKNFAAMKAHTKTAAYVNDKYGKALLNMLSEFSNVGRFMPIFTTRAVSYSVGDVAIKTLEKGGTFYGHTMKYGHYSEEHKLGSTTSIEFRNDAYWSILKTVYIWMMYIDIISRGDAIRPSWISQMSGILDYAGSLYYLATDLSGSRLIYWEKLTGVFPKSAPFSLLSMQDGPVIEDKITIEFDYGMRSDPMDPNVLFDINMLSANDNYTTAVRYMQFGPGSTQAYKLPDLRTPGGRALWYNATRADGFARGGATFGLGDQFAKKPIIQAIKGSNNTLNYYLHWLKS